MGSVIAFECHNAYLKFIIFSPIHMKIGSIIIIVLSLLVAITHTQYSSKINPYTILQVSQTATNSQIEAQYKKLRSKNRRSRAKKHMIRKAYDQILFERQFNTKQNVEVQQKTFQAPAAQHIDQAYLYGYKLGSEYDDGRYFKATFNQTQYILERSIKSEANKKTATLILFAGSIIFKMLPCIIIFCLCRRGGGESGLRNALLRARAGYANIGRRGNARI